MSSLDESSLSPSSEYQENLDILRQTYFFSGLPLESLKVFAYLCTRERFKTGAPLFLQGEEDADAFCIIAGQAQLERTLGTRVQVVRVYGPGEFIGGLTLLGETRRLYTLRALEDMTCLVLSREKFTKTIEQFPGQTPRLLKVVVDAINRWEEVFLEELTDECGKCIPRLGVSLI
jgi:CRP/FNR family transcriptional regulator, cyclic AMP receptor protein